MIPNWFRWSALVGLAAAASTVAAQESELSGHYALSWDIAPTEVPSEDFWVEEQGEIVETRLVPRGLYAAPADIVDTNGKLQVPAAAQLVSVHGPYPMACNVRPASGGRAKSKRVCVLDSNGDGAMDSAFTNGKGGDYWMSLEDELEDEKIFAIAPVVLTALDVNDMVDAPYLSFHYQRILDGGLQIPLTQEGGNMVRFHFKVGNERRREWMVRECRSPELPSQCTSANFPSTLSIAGLELELLERNKEDVRMRMIRSFGGQPVRFVEIHDGYNSGSLLYAD